MERHAIHSWALALVLAAVGCSDGACDDETHGVFSQAGVSVSIVPDTALKQLAGQALTFTDVAGVEWLAPLGTLTDGASIPQVALSVTGDRFGNDVLRAAIVHDAWCQEDNAQQTPEQYRKRTWQATHRMFYEALLAGCTSKAKALLLYSAVFLKGPRWPAPQATLDAQIDEGTLALLAVDGGEELLDEGGGALRPELPLLDSRLPARKRKAVARSYGLAVLVPDARLDQELEAARTWIGDGERTVEELETWLGERELALLEEGG